MITELLIAGVGVYTYRKIEYRINNREYIKECKRLKDLFLVHDKIYPIVDGNIQEEYGMRFIISLSEDSYTDLEKLQERLEVEYGCAIEIERNKNMKTATIYVLQKKLNDKDYKFKPYKCKANELYVGLSNKIKPIIVDMNSSPHLMVTGTTGMGKSEELKLILTNLIHNNTEKEVNIHICNVAHTEDYVDFDDCKQIKSITTSIKDTLKQFEYIIDLYEKRMGLFRSNKVKNIKEYNYKFKNSPKKIPNVYLVIDELADLYPMEGMDYLKEKNELYNTLCEIARKTRKCGIFLCLGIQRPSKDVLKPILKSNICTLIGFSQVNDASSLVAISDTCLTRIGRRNYLICYDDEWIWSRSIYIDKDMIQENVKDSIVTNRQLMSDFNVFLKDNSKSNESDSSKEKKNKPIKSIKKSKIVNINQEVATGKVSRVKNIEQVSNIDYTIQDGHICLKLRERVE